MRIVFMGSPDFAVASLEALADAGFSIVSVVTGPDKRRGRGTAHSATPVKSAALRYNLPVIEVDDLRNPDFADQLRALKPDLLVVVAFRVLPRTILDIPTRGAVNLHASLLPAYRGAAPIHRAVMNGETRTGTTVFFLDERVDTGSYIAQCQTFIDPDETTGQVYERLMHLGAQLLVHSVKQIQAGTYTLTQQDEALATAAPKLYASDCVIDFTRPASALHNQIRGLTPFPGAHTWLDDKRLKVQHSQPGPAMHLESGRIHFHDGKLLVACADNTTIALEKVQLEGKKPVDGASFFNGYTGDGRITSSGSG